MPLSPDTLFAQNYHEPKSGPTNGDEHPEAYMPPPQGAPITRRPSLAGSFPANDSNNDLLSHDGLDKEYVKAKVKDSVDSSVGFHQPVEFGINLWCKFCEMLRPSFLLDHLDLHSILVLLRSWIAAFVSILLETIHPSLKYLGASAYLVLIITVIQAPGGMTISQAFSTAVIDMISVVWGFTIATVAHAISWRIRGYPTKASVMKELVEEGICQLGDMKCFQHQMFSGRFLTTKTTVITIFGMLFSYSTLGYLPIISIILTPSFVIGAISTTICSIYLNFTPFFAPWTYGAYIVIPVGFAVCIRIACSTIFFPMTSNFRFFKMVSGSMMGVQKLLDTSVRTLSATKPSDKKFDDELKNFAEALPRTVAQFGILQIEAIFARCEFAYSRLDPGDLGEFRSLVRIVNNNLSGCQFYFNQISEKVAALDPTLAQGDDFHFAKKTDNKNTAEGTKHTSRLSQFQHLMPHVGQKFANQEKRQTGVYENIRTQHAEELFLNKMCLNDLDVLHAKVTEHYADLFNSLHNVLEAVVKWSAAVQSYRLWSLISPRSRKHHYESQKTCKEALINAQADLKENFDKVRTRDYRTWLQDFCETYRFKSRHHYLFFLEMDSFYECSLERLARSVQKLAAYSLFIDETQPEPRVIYPFMKTKSKAPRFESEYMSNGALGADSFRTRTAFVPGNPAIRRNPDSTAPRKAVHVMGLVIQKLWRILNNPNLNFVVKRAIFTVLACFTYFCRPTALWSYNYRIIWVPIMVALTVCAKAVDGIYGVVSKFLFTFLGSLIGMVIWYIGNGRGSGNSYGFTAALSVAMVVLMAYRHFHQLAVPMGAVVLCVTTVLVASTGWVDGQINSIDIDLGYGFRVAWIRFVSVSVALLIATIGTFLPQPVTAKKEIRKVIGDALELFGDCQASIANFALRRQFSPEVHIVPREDIILQRVRNIKALCLTARRLTSQIRYEPPLSGVWPRHKFELLNKMIWGMTFLLEDIYFFLDDVEHNSAMPMLLQLLGWTNTDLTSGLYSVLILGSRGLSSGSPLPSMTAGHLSDQYAQHIQNILQVSTKKYDLDIETFLEDKFLTHDGRLSLAMIMSSFSAFKRVDCSVSLIKDLVGEIYGLDESLYAYDQTPLLWASAADFENTGRT